MVHTFGKITLFQKLGTANTLATMEDHVEEHQQAAATAASASVSGSHKTGIQLLQELLAVVYHVLEEAKHMNLKPPLQPSSKLFHIDGSASATGNSSGSGGGGSPPRSPGVPEAQVDEHLNLNAEVNGGGAAASHHHHHPTAAGGALHPVIPYTPEEIQDSFTKIATLKNLYIKISTELQENIKAIDGAKQSHHGDDKVRNCCCNGCFRGKLEGIF